MTSVLAIPNVWISSELKVTELSAKSIKRSRIF